MGSDRQKKIEDAIETLFRELNCMGGEKEVGQVVVQAVSHQHRTLQQGFFGKVICPIITHFADMDSKNLYDLRNEATVKTASKLQETVKNSYFPFI